MKSQLRPIAASALILLATACNQGDQNYDQKVPQKVTKQIDEKKGTQQPAAPAVVSKAADAAKPAEAAAPKPAAAPTKVDLGEGLTYITTVEGTGEAVKGGNSAKLRTVLKTPQGGKLWAGDFEFLVGAGAAVAGYDKGVVGMKVGEKRTINVPSKFGYGATGMPPTIPPNQDLVFEVELLSYK